MENSMSIREKEKEKDDDEEESIPCHSRRKLATTSIKVPNREVRLAAIAIGLNIRLRSTDMSAPLQERAFRYARALIDSVSNRGPKMTRIAFILKKEFDTTYGPAWHCIVGKSFGSFVTHSPVDSFTSHSATFPFCCSKRKLDE